jgi:putative FmdB family regulatory protein
MPTYEYICRACGHEFEEFQSIKADPIAVCPKCRKKKVERKIGIGGAVIFKGGGFYETDYRSQSYKSGEEAEKKAGDSASADTSGAKAEGRTERRTEGKTEAQSGASSDAKPGAASEPKSGSRAEAPSAPKTDSKAQPKIDARSDARSDAKPGAKSDARPDASALAAENKRIESRATHQSRIGRGMGNIVGSGAKKPATPAKRARKK